MRAPPLLVLAALLAGVTASAGDPAGATGQAGDEHGFADLRIRDGAGAEVGYAVRRHDRGPAPRVAAVRVLDLVTLPSRETRFSLDVGRAPGVHSGVRLTIPERVKNFRVPARVETSADGRRWQVARAAGFIYVVEGESRAADTSVSYPPSTARWVRVTVGPAGGQPLPVEGAAVVFAAPVERHEETAAASIVERTEDVNRKSTS